MKIKDLRVDGFGIWKNLSIDDLSDTVTVFFGRNEAGKTTVMQFIRAVLYGFNAARRSRYLPPVDGGRGGGALKLATPGGEYIAVRQAIEPSKNGKANSANGNSKEAADADPQEREQLLRRGELSVLDGHGVVQSPDIFGALLGGVDESIFNNVFAIGLREIQELGALNDTAAAEHLYRLTSGLDRVSLVEVRKRLSTERESLLDAKGEDSKLEDLLERRQKLLRKIDEAREGGRRWVQAAQQRSALEREVKQLEALEKSLEKEAQALEVALAGRETWQARAKLEDRLAAYGPRPDVTVRTMERLDRLNEAIAQTKAAIEKLTQQRTELKAEGVALPINRALWAQADRVAAIGEHLPWLASLESQVQRLKRDVTQHDAELKTQFQSLGLSPEDAKKIAATPKKVWSALRGPARALRQQTRRLDELRAERDTNNDEAERLQNRVEAVLAERGEASLSTAIENAGRLVSQLRRRVQLEERVVQLADSHDELDAQVREMLNLQMLPFRKLLWLGAPFTIGAMLILTGIVGGFFWDFQEGTGWWLVIFGFMGLAFSAIWKTNVERSTVANLGARSEQLEALKAQLADAKQERERLDAIVPLTGESPGSRLASAQRELERLEGLLPLDGQRQSVGDKVAEAQAEAAHAAKAVEEAGRQWRAALKAAHLPETLSPVDVRALVMRLRSAEQNRRRIESLREESGQRERDLSALTSRIVEVFRDVNLTPNSSEPQLQLQQLVSALAEQRTLVERRREIGKLVRSLRKDQIQSRRTLEKLSRRRSALLAQSRVEDEDELRRRAALAAEIDSLHRRCEELTVEFRQAIGAEVKDAEVIAHLANGAEATLDRRWDELAGRFDANHKRIGELQERRGELNQELKTLGQDRRLGEARLELAGVERELRTALRRWRALSVAGVVLEAIRRRYETDRQPETMREASKYLKDLTQGHYTRVWTPFEEDALRVDDAEKRSLPVEVLSRGTREAVFLALRLALSASYARRGAVLPLVLDDVLVNFDADRTAAAARVLRDFARTGHQVLMFTCHEHIMRIFQEAEAQVRRLPSRDGRAEPVVVAPVIAPPVSIPEPVLVEAAPVVSAEPIVDPIPRAVPLPEPLPIAAKAPPAWLYEEETFDDAVEEPTLEMEREANEFDSDFSDGFEDYAEEPPVYPVRSEGEPQPSFWSYDDIRFAAAGVRDEVLDDAAQLVHRDRDSVPAGGAIDSGDQPFTWESPETWWRETSLDEEAAA